MTGRRLAVGAVASAAYLAVALSLAGAGRPVLPLFDGLGPAQPYRWVNPPPDAAEPGEEPLPGRIRTRLEPESAITVITNDGQAQASALTEGIEIPEDQNAVVATLTPLDPATIGPPPQGKRFDSNAYEASMTYAPSGEPIEVTGEVTILLQYARHGTVLNRWNGTEWEPLETSVLAGTLQVFGNTTDLGTFVVTGPPQPPGGGGEQEDGGGVAWPVWVAYGAAGVAVIAAVELIIRRRRAEPPKGKKKR